MRGIGEIPDGGHCPRSSHFIGVCEAWDVGKVLMNTLRFDLAGLVVPSP